MAVPGPAFVSSSASTAPAAPAERIHYKRGPAAGVWRSAGSGQTHTARDAQPSPPTSYDAVVNTSILGRGHPRIEADVPPGNSGASGLVFKDTPETKAYAAGLRALALRIRQADRFVGPDNRIITKEAIIDRTLNEHSGPEYNRLLRLAVAQDKASQIKTSGPFSVSEGLAGRELLNALGYDVGVVGDCHCNDYPERMASIDASGVNALRQAVVADWSREPRTVHIGGPAFNQHLDYEDIFGP